VLDVVEADEGEVARDRQAAFASSLRDADDRNVVDREDRRRPFGEIEQVQGGVVRVARVDRARLMVRFRRRAPWPR
jgi:hypothetical protein